MSRSCQLCFYKYGPLKTRNILLKSTLDYLAVSERNVSGEERNGSVDHMIYLQEQNQSKNG